MKNISISSIFTNSSIIECCEATFKEFPETFENDKPAQRMYFNNFTDSLYRSGIITMEQYESYVNPF